MAGIYARALQMSINRGAPIEGAPTSQTKQDRIGERNPIFPIESRSPPTNPANFRGLVPLCWTELKPGFPSCPRIVALATQPWPKRSEVDRRDQLAYGFAQR